MISEGTVLATANRMPVERVPHGEYCWAWDPRTSAPFSEPVVTAAEGEAEQIRVETWFEGTCRDCLHHTNTGAVIEVSLDQQFLLKSGEFMFGSDLQGGHRIRSIGCNCGYEEVKSVTPTPRGLVYSVRAENGNYAVSTTGQHAMVLRSDP